jgi:hypothetical protein
VLEAASGSTRGREAGLRGARLSALPYARIVLIALGKQRKTCFFFSSLVGRARARESSDHAASIAGKKNRNERNIGLTVETDEIEREKGIVFMGIPSAFPMKRVRSSACPEKQRACPPRVVFQSALLIE